MSSVGSRSHGVLLGSSVCSKEKFTVMDKVCQLRVRGSLFEVSECECLGLK